MSELSPSDAALTPSGQGPDAGREAVDDLLPILPKGDALFDGIPTRAVVIEELAPALGDGLLVVRRPTDIGVVLVRERNLFETYCFLGNGQRRLGSGALATLKSWEDATVSAYRLEPELVDVCPSLLRGEPLYVDLRLGWTDWGSLLADLASRDGTFIVELRTGVGRGVTCIANGKQIATFTEAHPELGAPTLLDPLAQSGRGSIWVRCEPAVLVVDSEQVELEPPVAIPAPAPAPPPAAPPPPVPADASPEPAAEPVSASPAARSDPLSAPAGATTVAAPVADPMTALSGALEGAFDAGDHDEGVEPEVHATGGAATNPFLSAPPAPVTAPPAPPENPFAAVFANTPTAPMPSTATASTGAAGGGSGSSLQDLLPELKLIARNRLQRSAARVEAVLDDAAETGKSLDAVLDEIRSLVIRGVMQATLDDVVDEMRLLVATHAA